MDAQHRPLARRAARAATPLVCAAVCSYCACLCHAAPARSAPSARSRPERSAAAARSAAVARSAAATGLVVVPRPLTPTGLSYFQLSVQPGHTARAGEIELRNPTAATQSVALGAVDGTTLNTLGSAYASPGSPPHGATLWVRVAPRAVTLAPGARAAVAVAVAVPAGATAGDYLSGIGVEALHQHDSAAPRAGVAIASAVRYAIGVEVSLPGPRDPLIRFTGAQLQRQPAGPTFLLDASNLGNAILTGVHGHVQIASAGHTVVSRPIPAGTFLAHTAIAYPVPAFAQQPAAGARYQIEAWLRYSGGIARLDTTIGPSASTAATATQRQHSSYGKPARTHSAAGSGWWRAALLAAALLYGLFTTILLLRRRRRERRAADAPARAPHGSAA